MIDIDMENTHPRLLAHYCKQNNTETPMLNDYIENRRDAEVTNGDFSVYKRSSKKELLAIVNERQRAPR